MGRGRSRPMAGAVQLEGARARSRRATSWPEFRNGETGAHAARLRLRSSNVAPFLERDSPLFPREIIGGTKGSANHPKPHASGVRSPCVGLRPASTWEFGIDWLDLRAMPPAAGPHRQQRPLSHSAGGPGSQSGQPRDEAGLATAFPGLANARGPSPRADRNLRGSRPVPGRHLPVQRLVAAGLNRNSETKFTEANKANEG